MREARSRLAAEGTQLQPVPAVSGLGTLRHRTCPRDSCSAAVQGAGARGPLETKANAHFTEAATVARGKAVPGAPRNEPEPDQTQRPRSLIQAPKP